MKRKSFAAAIVAVVVFLLVVIGIFEPTRIIQGLALREPFLNWRPTSYWRNIIRADGEDGKLTDDTLVVFHDLGAVRVLRECLSDPDPNVRWPSVLLMRRAALFPDVEGAARLALNDPHIDVRLAALQVVQSLGRNALSSIPRIIELTSDKDLEVSAAAHFALWEIDTDTALNAGQWKEFVSSDWHFSVVFPGSPELQHSTHQTPRGSAPIHSYSISFGFARCIVAVTEHPEPALDVSSAEDSYDAAGELIANAAGGALILNKRIQQHGQSGREQVIQVQGKAIMHIRAFLLGTRAYQVRIVYPPGTMSPKAVAYYLDSLRIDVK